MFSSTILCPVVKLVGMKLSFSEIVIASHAYCQMYCWPRKQVGYWSESKLDIGVKASWILE